MREFMFTCPHAMHVYVLARAHTHTVRTRALEYTCSHARTRTQYASAQTRAPTYACAHAHTRLHSFALTHSRAGEREV